MWLADWPTHPASQAAKVNELNFRAPSLLPSESSHCPDRGFQQQCSVITRSDLGRVHCSHNAAPASTRPWPSSMSTGAAELGVLVSCFYGLLCRSLIYGCGNTAQPALRATGTGPRAPRWRSHEKESGVCRRLPLLQPPPAGARHSKPVLFRTLGTGQALAPQPGQIWTSWSTRGSEDLFAN